MGYLPNSSHLIDYQKLDGSILTFNVSIQHTLVKKYDYIFDQVNTILDQDVNLNIMYDEFMNLLYDQEVIDFQRIKELLPEIMDLVDKYAEKNDYWKFSYSAPKKLSEYKLHIDSNGYLEIMKSSIRSKFICVPITQLRDKDSSIIRYIYNYICREMIDSGVQFKLERIIDSIALSASAKGLDSKSKLWLFFTTSKGLDPQNLALRERNSIFYKGLPTIATGLNPINWLVSLCRTSIAFQMKDKINELTISFDSPIESSYENSADMLKVFVYEEVTSNRKLMKLYKEFPFSMELINEYVYPITNWIAAPFISKVFNANNLNVTHLINILLLNIFTYKFLKDEESNWTIFKMLTYKVNNKINSNNKYYIPPNSTYMPNTYITNRIISNIIKNKINKLEFTKQTIYTTKQLEELFKMGIKTLLYYDYYDYEGNRIIINPIDIIEEYILYIYNLLTGKYNKVISSAQEYLKGV